MTSLNATFGVQTTASANAIPSSARSTSYDSAAVSAGTAVIKGPSDPAPLKERIILAAERYKALAAQFATFVLISTFSVGLIVSFLSFSVNVINPKNPSHERQMFNIGMLLAFIATGCHFGIIFVGGRATAVCFRIATPPSSDLDIEAAAREDSVHAEFRETLRKVDFTRYVTYCERLLLLGTLFLIASMLFMAFFVFSQLVYPVVICGLSLVGAFSVFRTGFWSMSVLREDIKRLASRRNQRNGKGGTKSATSEGGHSTATQGQ